MEPLQGQERHPQSGTVTRSVHLGVTVLQLNAPARMNAIGIDMREALIEALETSFLDENPAIIVTGAGGNFSAGGDMKAVRPEPARLARTMRHKLSRLQQLARLICSAPKPVVAAVPGKAMGAGMSIAVACDAIVAAENAQFCAAFGKMGLLPDAGILYTLPRRVGAAQAQRLMLSARTVEAAEALHIGLVDQVVSSGELMAAACAEAHRLCAIAPLALAAIKSLAGGGCETLEAAFSAELRLQPMLAMTADNQEARSAFADRRKAVFRGF